MDQTVNQTRVVCQIRYEIYLVNNCNQFFFNFTLLTQNNFLRQAQKTNQANVHVENT